MTLSIPDDVYRIVKAHNEIRWSEIARRAIEEYARKLALLNSMTAQSDLSEEEIMDLDRTVKAGVRKHYKSRTKGQ